MKFRMRRRDRYECDVPYPLPFDGKNHEFCSRENKQNRNLLGLLESAIMLQTSTLEINL